MGVITIDELKEHVARFTYKPGWYFNIHHQGYDGMPDNGYLVITFSVPDSNDPTGQQRFTGDYQQYFSLITIEHMTLEQWSRCYLLEGIWRIERHEIEEWLRYDGKRVVDPHPPPKFGGIMPILDALENGEQVTIR